MNVTINGYANYICVNCRKAHSAESQDCVFTEDSSPESEEDEYIRYTTQIKSPCLACHENIFIKLDVWEHPEAVSNYSYYSVEGAVKVQCEFTIEHFFDDAIALKEKSQNKPQANYEQRDEFGQEKEEQYNETPNNEFYTDQYDDND